jgi:hypothetical protein
VEFHTPLVPDPYELLNFMASVQVSGGSLGGFAAIKDALEAACNELSWRKRTEKVIVLIGDAPPFPEEEKSCFKIARGFKGKISAIYKPSTGTSTLEPVTTAFFQKLATGGEEDLYLKHEKHGDMVRRIMQGILGSRWKDNIDRLFDQKETDRWSNLLQRKMAEEGFAWFFRHFRKWQVRPELVDALTAMGGESVAREMWRIVNDDSIPPWLFQRALYVLRHLTNVSSDYMNSSRDRLSPGQRVALAEMLKRLYGADVVHEGNLPVHPD